MDQPLIIDTKMHGRTGITGAFVIRGEKTALVETGPKTTFERVMEGLRGYGVEHLDWIVVTHIHLDHAGAAGTLAKSFPSAMVAVHSIGAPHLVDPSKLWSSAGRIYGDRMESLWGGIDPLPESRIKILEDGDKIDLGNRSLQAVETPGHAYHHHAFLDDLTGILFTGDALGVRLPDVGLVRPATPPPEFHLEKAIASIDRIRRVGASSLWLTHFGPHDRGEKSMPVNDFCDAAIDALRMWETWVRDARAQTDDLDAASDIVRNSAREALERRVDESAIDRMEQTTSYRMNTWGYSRYLDKIAEA